MDMVLGDKRALEGLPFKILISVLVIALSAQPLYGSLSYLGYAQGLSLAMDEAQEIRKAALSAFIAGPGNVRIVSVDLGEGTPPFSIRLGGGVGDGSTRKIDVLYEGGAAATLTFEGEGLCLVGSAGKVFVVEHDQELRLSCISSRTGDVVMVEAL
jgi:hypothetical protein